MLLSQGLFMSFSAVIHTMVRIVEAQFKVKLIDIASAFSLCFLSPHIPYLGRAEVCREFLKQSLEVAMK